MLLFISGIQQVLVISQNIGGQLQVICCRPFSRLTSSRQIHTDWPSYLRNKGIFFVKRDRQAIPEIDTDQAEDSRDLLDYVTCGDIYPNVLGQIVMTSCSPGFT